MDQTVSIGVAFLAGMFSFFSPCTLPMIPIYLCYISGIKLVDLKTKKPSQYRIFLNSLFFIFGFSLLFILMGTFVGIIGAYTFVLFKKWMLRIGGILIILFGLYMLHIVKIPFLDKQGQFMLKFHKFSYFTSFLFGLTFAFGWVPCSTPILASLLVLATTTGSVNFSTLLLAVYSLGFAIPFMIVSLFTPFFLKFVSHEHRFTKYIYICSGILLIIIGLCLLTNEFGRLISILMNVDLWKQTNVEIEKLMNTVELWKNGC